MKLSPTQSEVLRKLATCEEPLVYFKGGYWTLPSIMEEHFKKSGSRGPTWHVSTGTVVALEKLGLLTQTGRATSYRIEHYSHLSDRVLSAQGLADATGSQVPMDKLIELVKDYTGHILHYRSFQRLDDDEWAAVIGSDSRITGGTAALTTDDNDIYIRVGFETDALHELVHAAGVKPDPHDTVFVCEGLTQAATEDIARLHDLNVRITYTDEVDFVRRYLVKTTGLPLRQLVSVYIDDGVPGLVEHIWQRCGAHFRNEEDWGAYERGKGNLEIELRQALGLGPRLSYLVDDLHI